MSTRVRKSRIRPAVGDYIAVYWPADDEWYRGHVLEWLAGDTQFVIGYDDKEVWVETLATCDLSVIRKGPPSIVHSFVCTTEDGTLLGYYLLKTGECLRLNVPEIS